MYVCVCHAVTDNDIRCAVAEGCGSLRQLREQLGVGKSCGRCKRCAHEAMTATSQPRVPQANITMRTIAA